MIQAGDGREARETEGGGAAGEPSKAPGAYVADASNGRQRASYLRLAVFTGNYNHIRDGVSLTLNGLVAFLEAAGATVLVVGPTVPEPPIDHRGTLIPVPSVPIPTRREYRLSLGLPRSVRRRLARFRPNLIHIATPDILGRRALHLARSWSVPAVASFHTHFAGYARHYAPAGLGTPVWAYLRDFYRRCEHIYVASPSTLDLLRANGVEGRIRLWQRGVDSNAFHPRHRSLPWRRRSGIQDGEVVILFVSRLVREKGLATLVGTFRRLDALGVRYRGLIVGDGPERADLCASLPRAIFLGCLEGEELARAYASSDVFLFPSDTETFGNVTLEAMASGLPTVCADAPGSRSLVVHGVTGFLAPPGGVGAFAGFAARLAARPDLRSDMGGAARERGLRYDWTVEHGRLLSHYREVLLAGGLASARRRSRKRIEQQRPAADGVPVYEHGG